MVAVDIIIIIMLACSTAASWSAPLFEEVFLFVCCAVEVEVCACTHYYQQLHFPQRTFSRTKE